MSRRNNLLFFALILLSFLLMTYQSRKGHLLTDNIIHNLMNHAYAVTKSFSDTVKAPFRKIALRNEENRRLQKKIDELLLEKNQYQEAVLENRRLRELLLLGEKTETSVTIAKVIARGTGNWSKTLVLDAGKKIGVQKDMFAITPEGLAGKIFRVSDSFSHLLLVTDINFSAAVRLQGSRTEGILSGTGAGKCMLKYIPYEDEVKSGDIVITSGLDSLFQPGIPVGYVSKVYDIGREGHFQSIEVSPFQDDTRLEEVLIVR